MKWCAAQLVICTRDLCSHLHSTGVKVATAQATGRGWCWRRQLRPAACIMACGGCKIGIRCCTPPLQSWVLRTENAGGARLQRFMNLIHADTPIMFAGNEEPAAFLEVGYCTFGLRLHLMTTSARWCKDACRPCGSDTRPATNRGAPDSLHACNDVSLHMPSTWSTDCQRA